MRMYAAPKHQLIFKGLHGVISQKTDLFITTAARNRDTSQVVCDSIVSSFCWMWLGRRIWPRDFRVEENTWLLFNIVGNWCGISPRWSSCAGGSYRVTPAGQAVYSYEAYIVQQSHVAYKVRTHTSVIFLLTNLRCSLRLILRSLSIRALHSSCLINKSKR
jgi:hypothetical protein